MSATYDQPCSEAELRAGREAAGACPKPRRPFVLAASVLGSAMVFIDGSALSVALPALRDAIGAGPGELNWIVNAYTVMLAALMLVGGAAGDRFGRRAVFIAGAGGFALASILCGLARTPELLIAARAAQGLFGAMLAPASLALIAAAYPREERAGAIGVWAGASALTTAGGPVLGGVLVDQIHWSAIFFINVPIAAGAVALSLVSPETRDREDPRPFDIAGAGLAAAALALIAFGLVGLGEGEAGIAAAAGALALGLALFAAFLVFEHRAGTPMVPLSLFRIRALSAANLFTLFAYFGLGATFFALPLLVSGTRGWSAGEIGLAFLPFTLAVGILSRALGGLAVRIGARQVMVAGAALAALGFAWLALFAGSAAWIGVYLPMGICGLGFAAFIPALTDTAVSSAPEGMEGVASGINNAVSRIASMLGVAAAAGFFAAGVPYLSYWAASALALAGAACGLFTYAPSHGANPR